MLSAEKERGSRLKPQKNFEGEDGEIAEASLLKVENAIRKQVGIHLYLLKFKTNKSPTPVYFPAEISKCGKIKLICRLHRAVVKIGNITNSTSFY